MRRIAVLSRRRALPALVAGTLLSCGSVIAVWQGQWQNDRNDIAMLAADGPQPELSAAPPECELLISCAHTPQGLSIAADAQTADILIAGAPFGKAATSSETCIIMPSDCRNLRHALAGSGRTVICCGLSRTDTLTVSSMRGDRLLLALQRELTALSGETIEPCELWARLPPQGTDVNDVLLACAAALLCGQTIDSEIVLKYARPPLLSSQ